jgi:hypothetical protein
VLLEHVAADQLPVEYGGTCTTCDRKDCPDCIKVYDSKEFQKSMVKDDDTDFQNQTSTSRNHPAAPDMRLTLITLIISIVSLSL